MKTLEKFVPIFLAIAFTLTVYWQVPIKGLVPFPGNLITGRFFPWNTQSWEGYPLGVPFKEFVQADAVRQTFPWRVLAIEQLKIGQMPWWNPYAFSGTPLLANLQSAPFYPLNIIYWLFENNTAWAVQTMLQPILAFMFMYLFGRSLKFSKIASIFSATAFAFSGYMTVWLELNTVGHAALWLPFILWNINRIFTKPKRTHVLPKHIAAYFLISFGTTASILAGHIQTTLYSVILSVIYFAFKLYISTNLQKISKDANFSKLQKIKKYFHQRQLILFFTSVIFALVVSSIQLVPALELLQLSPRSQTDEEVFTQFLLPISSTITFIAPNYFGNPSTNNFWGKDYAEFMGYFGITALTLSLISVTTKNKRHEEKLFLSVAVVCLLFALKTPLAYIPKLLSIPILKSSAPSRILFLVQFSGAVLAGFGLDKCLKSHNTANRPIAIVSALFLFIISLAGATWLFAQDPGVRNQQIVALRNTVIPLSIFSGFLLTIFLSRHFYRKKNTHTRLIIALAILFPLFGYSVFVNKYLPFSQPRFIFPEAQIFTQIKQLSQADRFFGDYTASVTSNSWIPSKVYSPEGYDSLYISRYGQLLAASQNNGKLPPKIPRSDANLAKNSDNFYRQRIQDLTSTKYILDKNDFPLSAWEPEPSRFPPSRYKLVWQQDKFKIYENLHALPRTYLVTRFQHVTSDLEIVDRIFDKSWDPLSSVILETKPKSLIQPFDFTNETTHRAQIIDYQPNSVSVQVTTPIPQILVISDSFYPGWVATVNGQPTQLLRANYTFKAVEVPAGNSLVELAYNPTNSLAVLLKYLK